MMLATEEDGMGGEHFDALVRRLEPAPTRRGLLHAMVAVGTSLGLVAGFDDTAAHKRKKKHRKERSSLCAKACSAGCSNCYQRPSGSLICGGAGATDCAASCQSDSDCIGKNGPICTKNFTSRATGETSSWGCPGNPPGVCTNLELCKV
jgi:hypothetical protein